MFGAKRSCSLIVAIISTSGVLYTNVFATAKVLCSGLPPHLFRFFLPSSQTCMAAQDEAAYLRQTVSWLVRLPVQLFASST
ncbi:hypothetical protein F4810DRAFT_678701 [Camillea tinctor]|nr:hypothetical protein F4810DRAFT_678701 [Camillea tinctor]